MLKHLLFAPLAALFTVAGAQAGTVIVVPGPSNSGYGLFDYSGSFRGISEEWSQTSEEDNLTVTALLSAPQSTVIDAFIADGSGLILMSDLNQTISTTNGFTTETLFSGIDLGPGTYYLDLAAPGVSHSLNWGQQEVNGGNTLGSGVTYLGEYISSGGSSTSLGNISGPGSTNLVFSITSAAPEPGSLWLMAGAGVAALATRLRKRLTTGE